MHIKLKDQIRAYVCVSHTSILIVNISHFIFQSMNNFIPFIRLGKNFHLTRGNLIRGQLLFFLIPKTKTKKKILVSIKHCPGGVWVRYHQGTINFYMTNTSEPGIIITQIQHRICAIIRHKSR